MKFFRAVPFFRSPGTVSCGALKQACLRLLAKYQYYNIHLALMLVLSYSSFSAILNFSFSPEYALLCFFSILSAYGLDNYKDFESDSKGWTLQLVYPSWNAKLKNKILMYQVYYPIILFAVIAAHVLKSNVLMLGLPAVLTAFHNFHFNVAGYKLGLKHIPFAKLLGVSFSFIYMAVLLPAWLQFHTISAETLKVAFFSLPFFIAGILLCDYRDKASDNPSGLIYAHTTLPAGKLVAWFGIIWMLYILTLGTGHYFLPGSALILSGGYGLGVLFLSSHLNPGLFQDLLFDSLAGVPFFLAVIAS